MAILTSKNWLPWSKAIASPADPTEYSPASISRLMDAIDNYVVDVKGIRPQFKAFNSVEVIDFRNSESRIRYEDAFNKFQQEKAKIQHKQENNTFGGNAGLQILVELLKFRMAAELEKIPDICDRMINAVENNREAAVAAFNFKQSIASAVKYLTDAGVPRDKISLIWGGGNTSTSKTKQKKLDIKKKIEGNKALQDLFEGADIDLYDLGLGNVEEAKKVEIEGLGLGAQGKEERQRNIDDFQKGKTLYCFFTLRAGGVGLSLHHTDELTKQKCRKKESGYVIEEDIPSIPTRPRRLFGATTYSAIELVQMLGRCPRLTSLSNTYQTILFYKDTIEEKVAWIVSLKLRCLRKVIRNINEGWEDVILGNYKQDDKNDPVAKLIREAQDGEEESPVDILFGEDDEDEETKAA